MTIELKPFDVPISSTRFRAPLSSKTVPAFGLLTNSSAWKTLKEVMIGVLAKKLGDPLIEFANSSGDGPQLYEHFGDKGQRLNDGRIFSD